MIAHLQQRGEERREEEQMRTEQYDRDLEMLEAQELELIRMLQHHQAEQQQIYADIEGEMEGMRSGPSLISQLEYELGSDLGAPHGLQGGGQASLA